MTTRTDTFTDTNGTGLLSHTATGTNGGWTWTNNDGTGSVAAINASNQLKLTGSAIGLFHAASVGSADQYAQADIQAASDSFPLIVRATGTSNDSFYGARFRLGNWEVYKCVTATFTNLLTSAATLTPGDTAKIQIVGSTLTFSVNGTQLLSTTVTDIATGDPGFAVRAADGATDPWIDSFLADVASSGGGGGGTGDTLGMQIFRPNQRAWR